MSLRKLLFFLCLIASPLFASSAECAGVSATDMAQAGMPPDLVQFAHAVSANEGSWTSESSKGCLGAFQFCPGTFEEYYSGTKEQFLNDSHAQVDAYRKYMTNRWAQAKKSGLTSAIGKSACWSNSCNIITESSILMACQFGCAPQSKLGNFIKNGYNCNGPLNTSDGYGTPVCKYLVTGANYNVSAITGGINDAKTPIQCLADLSSVQLYLSVPYGSARPGDGNGGNTWDKHSIGLSANKSGDSDNSPQVKVGIGGKAQWLPSTAPGGSSVVVSDGSVRVTYNNLSSLAGSVNSDPNVKTSQFLGLMTNMRAKDKVGSLGFSISMAVRQDALKAAGLAGRTGFDEPCPDCSVSSNGNTDLVSDKLKDAAGRSFFYVNPENFLKKPVTVLPEAMQAYPQAFSGRSKTSSLPSSCAINPEAMARSAPYSGGNGASMAGGTDGLSGARLGTEDFSVNQAQQAEHALWMELAHTEADDLRVATRDLEAQDAADISLAHLQLMEAAR